MARSDPEARSPTSLRCRLVRRGSASAAHIASRAMPARARELVFRSRVAGPNVVSTHEDGGTTERPTGLCFLAGTFDLPACCDSQRNPHQKIGSHTKERRKTRTTYSIKQKAAHVGLSAPHDGAQLKNADIAVPGSTHERQQGLRFGPRFKWLRQRHQNRLMENSSSSAPFQKGRVG